MVTIPNHKHTSVVNKAHNYHQNTQNLHIKNFTTIKKHKTIIKKTSYQIRLFERANVHKTELKSDKDAIESNEFSFYIEKL